MPDEDLTRTGLPYNCRALNGPPPFEPDKWDEQTNVYNNCYNYAVNIATGKMSWPGRYKGGPGRGRVGPAQRIEVRQERLEIEAFFCAWSGLLAPELWF